jgi:glutamate-ammonia-ligase adenylyltransferase
MPAAASAWSDDVPDWQRDLLVSAGPDAAHMLEQARALAEDLPEPGRAENDLRLFLGSQANPAVACRDFRNDPLALDLLLRLGATSRYGFDTARQWPGDFWQIMQERQFRQVWGRRTLAEHLTAELDACTGDDAQRRALCRFKHRHFLRIILGDIAGTLRFEAITAELSDVTDVLAQAAVDLALRELAPRLGRLMATPLLGESVSGLRPAVGQSASTPSFAVLAFGKLGARELNYSSDIDLVFVYHVPPDADPARDWHAAFTALGQAVIAALERPDGGAQLYRVDLRLRPEGDQGELALSLRETIDYYYAVGRPWERQALIKARPIAGDLRLGLRLLSELRPWVYPQEPDWETLDEARSMRRRIEERARGADVKTGAGGIRDIEFLVQFFQLCFGGRQADLRRRDTLPTLRLLADRGILPRADATTLEAHYIWLRVVEHRLQMYEDRQEHAVPTDPAARTRLAWACDGGGRVAFDARLALVRGEVRTLVERHFLADSRDTDAVLALVVRGEANPELATQVLAPFGLRDIATAAKLIKSLADEPFFVLARHRTERALAALLPALLTRCAATPDPDRTLADLARIVAVVGARATFFALLGKRHDLLDVVVGFAGWSAWLVEWFARVPGLIDEVLDGLASARRSPTLLTNEVRALVQGISDPSEPLRFFIGRESAITAIHDVTGRLTLAQVGERLSATVDAVVSTVLVRTAHDLTHAWGAPVDEHGRPVRFAILALGKLGGREMVYGSDLDVLFVCDPGGQCPRIDRDGEAFWTRVAQELTRVLGESGLYEIDPRLRPWGDQGPLVVSTRMLADYWGEPRDAWERMAMLRARHLAGDPGLGDEALAILRTAAYAAPAPADLHTQVVAMRRRLEDSVKGRDHLKRGPGGYVDHEFIAQALCLGLNPSLLLAHTGGSTATIAVLAALAELGRLPAAAAHELTAGLTTLRTIEARLRLATGTAVSAIPADPTARRELARRCGYELLEQFENILQEARARGHTWFTSLLG